MDIQMGGVAAGSQFDQVSVAGSLTLGGALVVSLIDGFTPQAGNSFDILDWMTLDGTFDALQLPVLADGLTWDVSQLYTTGMLTVASAGLPGDFNFDGSVDGADFLVWQRGGSPNPGSASDLGVWQSHHGSSSAAAASTTVPEPAAALWLPLMAAAVFTGRRLARR
jgi:hypothetical protein